MPSPPVVEIPINDTLKELGTTKLQKIDTLIFQIFLGENRLITVDIAKEASKTLKNLRDAAAESGLDKGKVDNLKTIVARDYPELLKLVEVKQETDTKSDKEREKSSASVAIWLVKKFCEEFFLDNLSQPFAAIKVDEHVEVIPIKNKRFRNWVSKLYYDATKQENKSDNAIGDILSSEALNSALRVIEGEAIFSKKEPKQLYLRVAKTEDETIYYDLVNKDWQAVKVTPEGWDIIYAPPIFKRRSHQRAQVFPDRNYPSDIFDKFIDLMRLSENPDNKLLFQCYIISLFYYGIVHAALMLHGEGGTAKTTRQSYHLIRKRPRM